MKVSVLIVTYNHGKYISQALESALEQRVAFDYEIVVGDDFSTDGTREILVEFQKRHPNRIRLLLHPQNLGLKGKMNFVQTFDACKGEYIALLEGDDYWTSPHKLQRQADFLDQHHECSVCFHSVCVVDSTGELKQSQMPDRTPKAFLSIDDLLVDNFIPTCSVMFRSHLFGNFPNWFFQLRQGDWPLHILNAQHGNIGYLDGAMGAYRVHDGGTWSSSDQIGQVESIIKVYRCFDTHFARKYRKTIRALISKRYYELARLHEKRGDFETAKQCFLKNLAEKPFNKYISQENRLRMLLRLYFPSVKTALKSLSVPFSAAGKSI